MIIGVAKAWDRIMPVRTGGGQADGGSNTDEGKLPMQIVLGPVVARKGGYAFDCWTPEEGLSRGYTYGRIEDARYARNIEIRSRNNKGSSDQTIACSVRVDESRVAEADLELEAGLCPCERRAGHAEIASPSGSTGGAFFAVSARIEIVGAWDLSSGQIAEESGIP